MGLEVCVLLFALTLLCSNVDGAAPTAAPAAAPAALERATRARVLVTDPQGTAGRDVKSVAVREIAAALTQYPALEALTYADLRRLVELQSERQLTTCDEAGMTECLAELQSALGVPWAVFVDVDEVGGLISVGVTLIGADHSALARETVSVTDAAELHDALAAPLRRLVTPLHETIRAPLPAPPPPIGTAPLLVGAGVVVAVAAGVVAVVGAQPWFAHEDARARLAALRAQALAAPDDAPALLKDAEGIQADQQAALDAWNQHGQLLVIIGAVGVGVGVGVVGSALFVE